MVRTRSFVSKGTMVVGVPANLCLAIVLVTSAVGQSAPVSWSHPWHSSAEQKALRDATTQPIYQLSDNPVKTYSLAELIDTAESNNPQTRVAWERARARAANLGVTRSELYPTLAAVALSRTSRSDLFLLCPGSCRGTGSFPNHFYDLVQQDFQVEMDLSYTILDFGGRSGRIDAAKAQLLAANFGFNDTHREVIYHVQGAYYHLLSSMGQEDAARASLANAQAVQAAAEARLAHGLATLPDVLEAKASTAQAEYDLQAIMGAEEIARGDLATAIGASAATAIKVQPLNQIPTPERIDDTVQEAIRRALAQRPDLLAQVAEIRSANARVKEAKAAYYPTLSVDASPALPYSYGLQSPNPWIHNGGLVGGVGFKLQWDAFDGGARKNRLAQEQAEVRASEALANVKRNQIGDEVWTAYSNLTTAFRQKQAAVALLESATESYGATLESYNYGLRNLLDVTASQRTLAQARLEDVLARTQVLTALADLAFRTGDSIRANPGRLQQ